MAERSGGFARFPLVEKAFASSMTEILAGIDAQYELVYAPVGGSDGSFRRIEVKAFRPGKDGSREDFEVSVRDRWRP